MSKIAVRGSAERSVKVEDPGMLSKKPKGRFRPLVHHSEYELAKTPSKENFWRKKYTCNLTEEVHFYDNPDEEENDPLSDDTLDELADAVVEMERLAFLENSSDQPAHNNEHSDGCSGVQRFTSTAEGNTTEFQFLGSPHDAAIVEQQFSNVINMTYEAFMMGKNLETRMLLEVFNDFDLTQWKDLLVQNWIPQVPTATKKHFGSYDRPLFFQEAYYLVQIYAIGFEQIVEDREKAHSPLAADFKNLYTKLKQMVKDFLESMNKLSIANYITFDKSVMPRQYRNLRAKICTELRDYVILTHFNQGSSYICRGFCYMRYGFSK